MKTVTKKYKVYQFNELSEDARQNVIEKIGDINVNYDWWEFVFEDAEQIGLKLTEFDIDRGSFCKGNFINSAEEVAKAIIDNHGDTCETYKTAKAYLAELEIAKGYASGEDDEIDSEDIDAEFLRSLLEDYRIMLRQEYEYLTSEKGIIETIEANDYNFLEDGTIFHN